MAAAQPIEVGIGGSGPEVGLTRKRPVEVLYMIDSLWGVGGAESSLARLVAALPPDRFRCRVVTFHGSPMGLDLIERTGWPVHLWQMDNLYDRNARSVARRIRNMVRAEGIDIVHTMFQTADLWAGPIAKLSGARYLISSRRDMGILRQTKHRIGYRLLHSMYDQVHAVSESVRQFTIDVDRIHPRKVVTVYNGIEVVGASSVASEQRRRLRQSMGIAGDQIAVATVANWRQVKGIDILVRAAAIAATRNPRIRFFLAGAFGMSPADKTFTDSVLEMARSLGADRFMTFLGQTEQVRELLQASDIFASPSRSEGLSNALLEAMESSLPVVASAVGGNPELVEDGVTGLLVPPEDPERLAEGILALAADPSRAQRMGETARQRVMAKFTTDAMVTQILDSYDALLRQDSPGRS